MQQQEVKHQIAVGCWIIDLHKQLGGGSYGTVFRCHKESNENVEFAAKKIPLSDNKKDTDKINTELTIFNKVNNPYVVKMHEFKKTPNSVYIIMDLCNQGSLSGYIRQNGALNVQQATDFIQKLVQGYKALRDQKVLHRDLKPDNVLIHNGIPKLTDFGLGRIFKDMEEMSGNITKSLVGSEYYMAPELLQYVKNAYKNGRLTEKPHYTDKCDVWSMGMVFYFMIVGQRPWEYGKQHPNQKEIPTETYINNINNKPILLRNTWPLALQHLLVRMLTPAVEKRISWEEVFQHPIMNVQAFSNVNTSQIEQQFIQEIQTYMQSYPVQYQQQPSQYLPSQQSSNNQFNTMPQQNIQNMQMPKKMGDSVEMSLENMEDD